jgi:hypothetical protein
VKSGRRGISHLDENVGVVLIVSLTGCGLSSFVALAMISKARRISAI